MINNTATNVVELATKADGTTTRATTEQVVITDEGKMGIGTTTAQAQLEVARNGKFVGTVTTAGVLANSDKRFIRFIIKKFV